jgi:MFS family permease
VVLAQLVTARVLSGRRRTRALMVLCGIWAAAWLLLALAGRAAGPVAMAGAVAVAVVFGVGETVLAPTVPAMVNDLAPEVLRGRYNGGATLAYTTGFLLGPAVGGFALAALGGVWFVVLGATCAVGVLLASRLESRLSAGANGVGPALALGVPA